jgi:uncharacterized protein (DUF302 family)
MKILILISLFLLVNIWAFVPSNNKVLAITYTFDQINDKQFDEFTLKDLKKIGYYLNDPHHKVNKAYKQMYGHTDLSSIGFFPILNEEVVRTLLNKDPRLGAFNPFNLLHYRKKSDMKTVIAHLTPEAILDFLEISDKNIKKQYIESFKPLDDLITQKLGGVKSTIKLEAYANNTMMNYEIPFKEPEDIDDFLDEFQEKFKLAFVNKGFVIAGFYNIKDSLNSQKDVMPNFTSYWVFDLCHIPFSSVVFDGKDGIPEVGIFAPCAMYVYVKKGENKIVIGMPTLSTWVSAFGIKDKKRVKSMLKLDKEIKSILENLGGIAIKNSNSLKEL